MGKTCKACGKLLVRRADEDSRNFKKRQTCGRICAASIHPSCQKRRTGSFCCPVCGTLVERPYGYSNAQWARRKTCSPACAATTLPGSPQIPVDFRFHDKYIPEPNSGCWLWEGTVGNHGYGVIIMDRVNTVAHRVSWILHNGVIPDGLWVLHKCDNRQCVNPQHLFLGTPSDNMLDAIAKGRRERAPTAKYRFWDSQHG